MKQYIKNTIYLCFVCFLSACYVSKAPYESVGNLSQIYLSNEISLKNGAKIKNVGSAFLIDYQGQAYACTAKHVAEKAKRLKPSVSSKTLNKELDYWHVYPRKKGKPIIEIDSLLNSNVEDDEWWIFSLKNIAPKIVRLPIRKTPIEDGAAIFFPGCPYAEKKCRQNIYLGKIKNQSAKYLHIEYAPLTNVAGFSGGPLLDKQGQVIGMLTKARYDDTQKKHSSIYAEKTDYLLAFLKEYTEQKK